MRSSGRQVRDRRRRAGVRAARAAGVGGARPSGLHPVLRQRLLGQPSRRATGAGSRTAAAARRRRRLDCTAGALSASAFSTIVAASGRSGSKRKVRPSSGFGREARRARDHREHDRLAERAGAGEHGGGDDRRARGAHRDRPHRAPAVDAERERRPRVQPRGTARSASTMIAIMIGVIITVRITTGDEQAGARSSWTTYCTDCLALGVMRWSPTNGTSTRIPISP